MRSAVVGSSAWRAKIQEWREFKVIGRSHLPSPSKVSPMKDGVASRYLGLRQGGQYKRQLWGADCWFAGVKKNIAQHARAEHSVTLYFEEVIGD